MRRPWRSHWPDAHPIGTIERMFVTAPDRRLSRNRDPAALAALAALAERTRPVAASRTRLLPVAPPLAGLLPDGALRRGTTLTVGGPGDDGALSVALALVAAASASGSWCALVGRPGLGAVAASDLGIDLGRLALLPRPGPSWAEATAAVLEGVDMVPAVPAPTGQGPAPGGPGPRAPGRPGGGAGAGGLARAARPTTADRRRDVGGGRRRRGLPPSTPDDGDRHRPQVRGTTHQVRAVAA
jgi:hypothetical protein